MRKFFMVEANKYNSCKDFQVYRPASLNRPASNSVMFVCKNFLSKADVLYTIDECIVFWPEGVEIPAELAEKHVMIPAEDPRQAFAVFFCDNKITYYPENCKYVQLNGAFLSEEAKIGENTEIFPGAYVGNEVTIGNHCYIGAGVKLIGKVTIGNNVVVRENTVIGADGLTTRRKADGSAATIPQFGGVLIEDGVQIGANTVIARGAIDDTVIHTGAKIDNLCFISHNVEIGAHSFVVGETIMFGSSSLGEYAYVSGNSTIRDGVHVGKRALVGMGSVVVKPVADDAIVKGNPAR